MVQSFLLLHVITNEKTLKLKQVDGLPALPGFSPQKHVPTALVGIPVVIYTLDLHRAVQVKSINEINGPGHTALIPFLPESITQSKYHPCSVVARSVTERLATQ